MRKVISIVVVALSVMFGVYAETGFASTAEPSPAYQIWPLGDSITEGMTNSAALVPGGYRAPLNDLLTSAGVVHQFVGTSTANPTLALIQQAETQHDGHPGYRIDQIS